MWGYQNTSIRRWLGALVAVLCATVAALAVAPATQAAPPGSSSRCGQVVVVAPGDTLWRIATQCGVTLDAIRQANPGTDLSVIYPRQVIHMPVETTVYVIRAGDTVYSIARRFGVTIGELHDLNPWLASARFIYPGQRLLIPVTDGTWDGQSVASPRYGYQAAIPSGWKMDIETRPQAGPARNLETVTLYQPGYGYPGLFDRVFIRASQNAPATTGLPCGGKVMVDGVQACINAMPAVQNPNQMVAHFAHDGVYYEVQLVYTDVASERVFHQVLNTFRFPR